MAFSGAAAADGPPKIHLLHENDAWVAPLCAALADLGLPYEAWFLDEGRLDPAAAPPEGVFYSRMSASAHTRGHRHAAALARAVLGWLEAHDRRVINGTRALALELSKVAQHLALARAGIRTPRTAAAVGRDEVLALSDDFGGGPYILKPNRGGKGLGVRLLPDRTALADYLAGPGAGEDAPIDGIWLLQEYVRPAEPFITRCEFVGGRFLYALRVDTSGGFALCPADACSIEDLACPVGGGPAKFAIQPAFDHPLLARFERFLADNRIEVAGLEFITDAAGDAFTYDVNVNTNYNAEAERAAGVSVTGMQAVARFLGQALARPGDAGEAAAE